MQLPMPLVGMPASVWLGVASTAAQWCPVNPGGWKMFSHPATPRAVVWHVFEETLSLGKNNSHPPFSQLLAVIVCWETFTNGCASLKTCRIISLLDCSEQLVTSKFQAAHMWLRCSFCARSVWSTQTLPSPKGRLQEEASSIQLLGPCGCFVVHNLYASSHSVSLY